MIIGQYEAADQENQREIAREEDAYEQAEPPGLCEALRSKINQQIDGTNAWYVLRDALRLAEPFENRRKAAEQQIADLKEAYDSMAHSLAEAKSRLVAERDRADAAEIDARSTMTNLGGMTLLWKAEKECAFVAEAEAAALRRRVAELEAQISSKKL